MSHNLDFDDLRVRAFCRWYNTNNSDKVKPDDVNLSSGYLIEYGRNSWIVASDVEADELWDQELENYIDEIIIPELPRHFQNYFDREAWKRDARYDGRAHSLARYDGNEDEVTYLGETFYIYQTN